MYINHFVIDTINWLLDMVSYNSGGVVLVISNRPLAKRSADLQLIARLQTEFDGTKSCYYNII